MSEVGHFGAPPWELAAPRPRVRVVRNRPLLHLLLVLATAATASLAGALQAGRDPFGEPATLVDGIPYALALLAILLAHEFGHYLMCRRYGVDASLPYFLPGPPLPGTFGAFIRIRSPFPDRRALFDIGAAGPWAGAVVAVALTIVGLARSDVLPAVPSGGIVLGDSVLTTWLVRLVLGVEPDRVAFDPLVSAGWFGLLVTALNLLPVGQLDGGHVLYAVGRGRGMRLVPAFLIASLAWLGTSGWAGWLVWALVATAIQILGHPPTLDDPRPLGAGRRLAAAATFVL